MSLPWKYCVVADDLWDLGLLCGMDLFNTGVVPSNNKENLAPSTNELLEKSSFEDSSVASSSSPCDKQARTATSTRTIYSHGVELQKCKSVEKSLSGTLAKNSDTHVLWDIRNALAQGWIYRRASGRDLSNTVWQNCWAELSLNSEWDYEIDVPILRFYLSKEAAIPLTMIKLASTVIVVSNKRFNLPNTSDEYASFDIVQVRSSSARITIHEKVSSQAFFVPIHDQKNWTTAINAALVMFESAKIKQKGGTKQLLTLSSKIKGEKESSGPLVERKQKHPNELEQDERLDLHITNRSGTTSCQKGGMGTF